MYRRVKLVAGVPHELTFHDLRHNYGSYLLHKDVNIAQISKVLGHSSVAVTMNIYVHEMKEDWSKLLIAVSSM